MTTLRSFATFVTIVLTFGCDSSSAPRTLRVTGAIQTSDSNAVQAAAVDTRAASPEESCGRPLRAVVVQDITGSGEVNVTPIASESQLDPLLQYVIRCGGELGFGFIQTQSNRPLVRFFVRPPDPEPGHLPFSGPPFQVLKRKREYAAAMARYRSADSARIGEAIIRATEFRARVDTLLHSPATQSRTDVWGAIARCAQFLNEDGGDPSSREYHLAAIVVSDAADNAHRPRIEQLAGELYLINGLPLPGALDALHPLRFESIDAAVRNLLANR